MIFRKLELANDFIDYQKYIDIQSKSMLYHNLKFINFIAKILQAEKELFAVFDNDKITAVCPWIVKKGNAGKVYNSLAYFGSNGGIIANDKESKESIEAQMLDYLNKNASAFAYVSNLFEDNRLKHNSDYITLERLAQVAILPDNVVNNGENILEIFHYKTRNMVRKGLKENIVFRTTDDFSFLQKTHCKNMEAVGIAPKEALFFENLPNFFENGKDFQVYEALIDGVQACALLVFYHQETVEYYMPAILAEYRDKQALSALIFYTMQQEVNKGRNIWNWGGTPKSNENLYRFKARWGSTDYPYFYQIKINDKAIFKRSVEEITNQYQGLFVAPFDMLNGN